MLQKRIGIRAACAHAIL